MTEILPGVQLTKNNASSLGLAGSTIRNGSVNQQALTAATLTYLTGSALKILGGLKAGMKFRWRFNMAKTAAGTATSTFAIAVGTAGDTTDTARVSFTKPAGTAVADEGIVTIEAVVRAVSNTAGKMVGEFTLVHNLAATGHAQIPCVVVNTISANFDNDNNDLYVGLVATTGAADAITIEFLDAEVTGVPDLANA
jgi:hypothetical protein